MILTAAAVFFLLFWNKKKPENAEHTQDLFRFKSITKDGIIETPDGFYRLVLEVEPVNIALMSPVEQEATWTAFRELLSTLTTNLFFCVQSRHLDLKQYLGWLDARANNIKAHEKIYQYHESMRAFLEQQNAERSIKDHRHYLILEINPEEISGNVQLQSEALSTLASGFTKKTLSREEAKNVAKQELENAAMIAQSFFHRMGMESYRLNYTGVLEVCYSALNRDLAPVARFEDIHHQQMLSFRTHSITPEFAMEVPPDVQEEEAS